MLIGFTLAAAFPRLAARAFTTDQQLISRSVWAIRVTFVTFPIIGFQMVTTSFFQCIGKVKISIFLSLTRQLIFLMPLVYILPRFFGLNGVWYAMPCSDLLSTLLTGVALIYALHRFKSDNQIS